MLETMRKRAQHPVVKGLFFLLAIMFIVWGVGDVFRGNGGDRYVATVGKYGITHAELDNVVRGEIARYQEIIGKTLTEEDAEKLGIKRYALSQLIRNKVTIARAEDLNLIAGKKVIAQNIYKNDNFFDEEGKFDKNRFNAVLQQHGFTEEKFISAIKRDSSVNTLLSSITISSVTPDAMARQVFIAKNESRVADLIVIPADLIKEAPEPSEADLIQYYNENQDNFSVPEQRAITYVTFNVDKIKGSIKPSEEELQSHYNSSISQYKAEETRELEQYLFVKEEDANAAYEKISKGDVKAFASNEIDLGSITKSNAPIEVKEAIFSLKQGEVSKPVQSSLGWHILVLKSIEPAKIRSFDEVKKEIEQELIEKKLSTEFSKFGNEIEDEFAAGKSMEDVAQKFDLIIHRIPAIDGSGIGANGSKVTDLPDPNLLLPVAFNLDTGVASTLTLLSDNASYAIVRVDSITPKRVKALDEVKGIAIKLRKDQDKAKLLKEKAAEFATKLKAGEDAKTFAAKMKLKIKEAQNIKRPNAETVQDGSSGEPVMMAAELFNLKKQGDYTGAYRANDGTFVIAKLIKVEKKSPEKDKNSYKNLQSQLEDEIRDDIMNQYINYLRNKYAVTVKTEAVGGINPAENN